MSWPQYETMVWMKVVICGDSFEEATIMGMTLYKIEFIVLCDEAVP